MRLAALKARWALAIYLGLAVLQTWPLAAHVSTRLTGDPGADTGVYVWNVWVFRHELVDHHRSPFWTDAVLPLNGLTDLSLHNYTVWSDLLALPLQGWIGTVAAFNVAFILNAALAGLGLFVLARLVTGRTAESFIAGLLFQWSPFLVARGMAHYSLAAAAPLPFFLYWLLRSRQSRRFRDAALAGVMIAWAGCCDPYYAIYCVMLAAMVFGSDVLTFVRTTPGRAARLTSRALDGLMIAMVAAVILVAGVAHGSLRLGGTTVSMRTFYTPMLVLAVCAVARVLISWRPHVRAIAWPDVRATIAGSAIAGAAGGVLLAPEFVAMAGLAIRGEFVTPPVLWRSSAPGLDLLAFLLPNPNHPLAPASLVHWFARQPNRFEENVASLPIVGFAILALAWVKARYRPAALWAAITIGFASIAVGPFLVIGGLHTDLPTPWAILRYVPVVSQARMPPRFAAVVVMGFSVLVASALSALANRWPAHRRAVLATAGLLLAFELLPAPRPLFAAEASPVMQRLAAAPRPAVVLPLPTGIRDGLSSIGNFSALSQFNQIFHQKPIIGGYLSRVSNQTKMYYLQQPVLNVLADLSGGVRPTPEQLAEAVATGSDFAAQVHLGYVLIDESRASPDIVQFATDAFRLRSMAQDGRYHLYRVLPRRRVVP